MISKLEIKEKELALLNMVGEFCAERLDDD